MSERARKLVMLSQLAYDSIHETPENVVRPESEVTIEPKSINNVCVKEASNVINNETCAVSDLIFDGDVSVFDLDNVPLCYSTDTRTIITGGAELGESANNASEIGRLSSHSDNNYLTCLPANNPSFVNDESSKEKNNHLREGKF